MYTHAHKTPHIVFHVYYTYFLVAIMLDQKR